MRYSAWIKMGEHQRSDCFIVDISATGARLGVDAVDELPEHFTLVLSKQGAQRPCRAVWRSSNQIGVKFEKPGR